MAERAQPETVDAHRLRQGWVGLYAAAFVLMLMAAAILLIAALGSLSSIRLLWASVAFSFAALVAAAASVVAPRR
ncbi:MAG: hypothetical protein ACRDH0_01910 [Actinomycetota bacterium]